MLQFSSIKVKHFWASTSTLSNRSREECTSTDGLFESVMAATASDT